MIDNDLRRMFLADDCSNEERALLATLRGMTIAECKHEFSKQVKFDYVMRDENIIVRIDSNESENASYDVEISTMLLCIGDTKLLSLCDNVDVDTSRAWSALPY